MTPPHARRHRARACAAATACAAWGLLLGACSQTTVLNTRYTLARDVQPGQPRTITQDDRNTRIGTTLAELRSTLRMDHDGVTPPVISPDGRFAAVQTASDAAWNVRLGDPPPPEGMRSRIEGVSLEADNLGFPLTTLEGTWLLGRAATNEAFLVDRPNPDGSRDILLAPWSGGMAHQVAADGWTNAFATITPGGSLAWSRRHPEGGDWHLVVQRQGVRRVLSGGEGESWLFPVFAGDGTGLFVLRLNQGSLVVAWVPFEEDGLPDPDVLRAPLATLPLALGASLGTAASVLQWEGGMAASGPGSDRLTFYAPGLERTATWTPGDRMEPLTERSWAATMLDDEVVLVTTPEMLGRQQLGDPEQRVQMMADGPWVARPTVISPTVVMVMRTLSGRVELAMLDIRAVPAAR